MPVAGETIRHLRLERDRHVAFAFAAADLLIEVSLDGTIIAAAGAAHAILGADIPQAWPASHPGLRGSRRPAPGPAAAQAGSCAVSHRSASWWAWCGRMARRDSTLFGGVPAAGPGRQHIPECGSGAGCARADRPAARCGDRSADGGCTARRGTAPRRDGGGAARQLQLVRLDGLSGAARQLPGRIALEMLMQEIGAASARQLDRRRRRRSPGRGCLRRRDPRPATIRAHDAALVADLADAMRGAGIPDGQVPIRASRGSISRSAG